MGTRWSVWTLPWCPSVCPGHLDSEPVTCVIRKKIAAMVLLPRHYMFLCDVLWVHLLPESWVVSIFSNYKKDAGRKVS